MSESTLEHALEVKRRTEDRILGIPGVHAITVAPRDGGAAAIVVYVARKRAENEIPEEERIPAEIEGVPTEVVEAAQMQPF
jgi:hypothetical protein